MKRTCQLSVFLFFCSTASSIKAEDLSLTHIKEKLHLTQSELDLRGKLEIQGFVNSNIWQGGYYEGDPLNPAGASSYQVSMRYEGKNLSPLYVCYLKCLKPFVRSHSDVLEIGAGGGAWSKAILSLRPKSLTCLDALSAEYNLFWNRIGQRPNVRYIQVQDFLLNELPEASFDFVFSFGTFCHISPLMFYEYFKNLAPKLRKGAQGFILYADFDKKNIFATKYNLPKHRAQKVDELALFQQQKDTGDFFPRWYHLGIKRAQDILRELGYEVITGDTKANERDPILHFRKP